MSTVGQQGMRRPSAMGGVCNVFRPGAHPQRSGTYRLECHWRTASTIQVFDHTLRAYPEYSVAEEDRLGRSGAAPVHFIRCTVR